MAPTFGCLALSLAPVPHRAAAVRRAEPAPVFRPASGSLAGVTCVPILLPSKLPEHLRARAIVARGDTAEGGYAITLRYRGVPGDAGYAAGFFGHPGHLARAAGDSAVRLTDGTRALFRPVACGGSCAPANLWWERGGLVYAIQIALPPDGGAHEQLRELLATAAAVVPAAARGAGPERPGAQ